MGKFTMVEQADTGRDGFIYSWLMSVRYRGTHFYPGWQWVAGAGCKGCYRTRDASLALAMAVRLGVQIESNSSHKAIGAPYTLAYQASRGLGVTQAAV